MYVMFINHTFAMFVLHKNWCIIALSPSYAILVLQHHVHWPKSLLWVTLLPTVSRGSAVCTWIVVNFYAVLSKTECQDVHLIYPRSSFPAGEPSSAEVFLISQRRFLPFLMPATKMIGKFYWEVPVRNADSASILLVFSNSESNEPPHLMNKVFLWVGEQIKDIHRRNLS